MSKKQRNLAPARATCVFCALILSGKGAVVLSGARQRRPLTGGLAWFSAWRIRPHNAAA